MTENCAKGRRVMCDMSYTDLANVYDVVAKAFYNTDDDDITRAAYMFLNKLFDKLYTEKKCPRCGEYLLLSDVDEYDYVCVNCDENYYKSEVQDK